VLVNEAEVSTIKGFKVDLIDDWMLDSLGLTETTGLREDFLKTEEEVLDGAVEV